MKLIIFTLALLASIQSDSMATEYCVDIPEEAITNAKNFRMPAGTVEDYIYFAVRQQSLKDLSDKDESFFRQRRLQREDAEKGKFPPNRPQRPPRPQGPGNNPNGG